MNQANTITVNNVSYVRTDCVQDTAKFEGPIKIVVLDKGFVLVGRLESTDQGGGIIHDASFVRVWGTTKGLGELAGGALPNTKLDAAGTVRFPEHALIMTLDVDQTKWAR